MQCNKLRPAVKNGSKGTVLELCCTRNEKDCKFQLFYEYTTDGFVLYNFHSCHNDHLLAQSHPEVTATGPGCGIPTSFMDLGGLLAEAGFLTCNIFRVFVLKAK